MKMRLSSWLGLWPALVLGLALSAMAPVRADTGHPAAQALARAHAAMTAQALGVDANTAQVIVQYRRGAAVLNASPRRPQHAAALASRLSLKLDDGRVLGERMQALRGRGMTSAELAKRLAAQPDVEWAVVDGRKGIAAVPNDPYFGAGQTAVTPAVGQWFLRAPDSTLVSATNAVGAWDVTTGLSSITVAVLDTGVRYDHPDLAGKLYAGYDFVRSAIDSDGTAGPDTDATDPGDGIGCTTDTTSSWHGTQVAGLVGAATDNGLGVAGLGRNVMVLPVRVLGQCGSGYDNDIIAGMRWAAGLSNDASCTASSAVSATCNPHPAKVINMSLGGSGSCGSAYQTVVNELVAANVAVVVAAGNDAGHAVNSPANCTGAIAVAGVRHVGTKVGYSNLGSQVTVAAPAGNCVNTASGSPCLYPLMTTVNLGSTTPGANGYSDSYDHPSLGTSFASPLVAGTVALMRSLNASLTPAQVTTILKSSARAFPTTGGTDSSVAACHAPTGVDQLECYCTTSTCGAGMLDSAAAVNQVFQAVAAPNVLISAATTTPTAGTSVTLDGSGSSANGGRSIASRLWTVVSGSASFTGATNGPTATLQTTAVGTVVVRLTVTDSAGVSSNTTQTLTVVAAPVAAITPSTTAPTAGDSVTLSASNSSAGSGRSITGWQWAVTSGASLASLSGTANTATATLLTSTAGSVTVTLTVTDSAGATATASQVITVLAAPVVSVTVPTSTVTSGSTVTLDASASSAASGQRIASYAWAVTSGNATISGAANASTVTLLTTGTGTVTVSLTITDDAGAKTTSSTSVTVEAAAGSGSGTGSGSTTTPSTGSGGGGGGALGFGWLLGLAAAVWALRPRRSPAV